MHLQNDIVEEAIAEGIDLSTFATNTPPKFIFKGYIFKSNDAEAEPILGNLNGVFMCEQYAFALVPTKTNSCAGAPKKSLASSLYQKYDRATGTIDLDRFTLYQYTPRQVRKPPSLLLCTQPPPKRQRAMVHFEEFEDMLWKRHRPDVGVLRFGA